MKKKFIGIIMIVLTLSVLIAWEMWGEEYFLYSEILVLKNDIQENTIITDKMLKTVKVEKADERALKSSDLESIISKKSKQYIPSDVPIFKEYFEEKEYSYGDDTNLSVLSIPSNWLHVMPQSIKRGDRAFFYSDGNLISECTVIHVKDADNTEIQYSDVERLLPSGNISLIEILTTEEQIEKMSKIVNEDKKFLVTYK